MSETLGDKLLEAIINANLFTVDYDGVTAPIIIWSSGAAEQLEAIVASLGLPNDAAKEEKEV